MQSLNPFNYSLAQLQKALIAAIPLVFVLLSLVVGWVPVEGFEEAVLALVGPLFLLVGVFAAKNHDSQTFEKALKALAGAALTVATYFPNVDVASWDNKIALGITLLVAIFGVLFKQQQPASVPPAPGR